VNLAIAGAAPYELPVSEWVLSNAIQTPDGRQETVGGIYVFWFVADGEETPNHDQFMRWLALDLLRKAVWQRWTYVSYFSVCEPARRTRRCAHGKSDCGVRAGVSIAAGPALNG